MEPALTSEPAPFRVGVTGHRRFDAPDAVAAEIAAIGAQLAATAGDRPVEVWSSLAEGADRLVARELLDRGARLVAVLPLEPDEYRRDFPTADSIAAFDHLLRGAAAVHITASADPDREAAYEAAGLAVLSACDVLVAVWDGLTARGRGGTAQIVEAARRRGTDVVVVPVTRDNV